MLIEKVQKVRANISENIDITQSLGILRELIEDYHHFYDLAANYLQHLQKNVVCSGPENSEHVAGHTTMIINQTWLLIIKGLMIEERKRHIAKRQVLVGNQAGDKLQLLSSEEEMSLRFPIEGFENDMKFGKATPENIPIMYKYARERLREINWKCYGYENAKVAFESLMSILDCIIFFERNVTSYKKPNYLDRISKLQKRQLGFLVEIMDVAKANVLESACKYWTLQIGYKYQDLFETKLSILERGQVEGVRQKLAKLAFLNSKSEEYYLNFLNIDAGIEQVEVQVDKSLNFSEKVQMLETIFSLARLHNRFLTPNRKDQLRHVNLAIGYYEQFVREVKNDAELRDKLQDRLKKSVETSDLLKRQLKVVEESG